MVRPHMTLAAGLRLPRERDGSGVAGMALDTRADAAIGVGSANVVAGKASQIQHAFAFSLCQGIWWTTHGARVVFFGERDLLNGKRRRAEHGRIRRRSVSASDELIVFRCVTLPAV